MDRQKLLVAVSGGVDSVVLLDVLAKSNRYDLIVAHFDHGIRSDSAADARFVEALAAIYKLPFVLRREELGAQASEERARKARYDFLFATAKQHEATVATAHHMDDVVETVVINILRGTGWRGVAVLDRAGVVRPLLHKSKQEIRDYATEHRLEWVEDTTNAGEKYLRNRLRKRIGQRLLIARKLQLVALRDAQVDLKKTIDAECERQLPFPPYSRYFFANQAADSASELLRAIIVQHIKSGATRPQLERALVAIKTAKPAATHDVGAGVRLLFTERTFIVEKG
jgi:tRNA(Ile)-lysidine synthase